VIKMDVNNQRVEKIYFQRLDFYYQTLAIYSIVIVVYSILRGSIEGGTLTVRLLDPITILLALFIIGTSIALLYDSIRRRSIIVGKDYIIFRLGKKEKKYNFNEIERIAVVPDKTFRFRSSYSTAMIKLPERRRMLRLRFTSYENEKDLYEDVIRIKKIIEEK